MNIRFSKTRFSIYLCKLFVCCDETIIMMVHKEALIRLSAIATFLVLLVVNTKTCMYSLRLASHFLLVISFDRVLK